MTQINHKEVPVEDWGWINTDSCPCKDDYAHYLWMAAPEIEWHYVEDVGSYQGVVYALGKYQGKYFVMKDYYGSCSGCGAWGAGGEPEGLKDVLSNGELYDNKKDAIEKTRKIYEGEYENPTNSFWEALINL